MKLCDEVAGLAAVRHSRCRVVTAGMDRMTFLEPIHIGELVTFTASVNAAWRTSMEVGVRVEAEQPREGTRAPHEHRLPDDGRARRRRAARPRCRRCWRSPRTSGGASARRRRAAATGWRSATSCSATARPERRPLGLEPERVARLEAARVAQRDAPARAALGRARDLAARDAARARVQAQAGDDGEGVARVRVDRDPRALALQAPAQEARGVQRALEQLGREQRVGDGARAVVARVLDLGVTAAVLVRLVEQLVGGEDRRPAPAGARRRARRPSRRAAAWPSSPGATIGAGSEN